MCIFQKRFNNNFIYIQMKHTCFDIHCQIDSQSTLWNRKENMRAYKILKNRVEDELIDWYIAIILRNTASPGNLNPAILSASEIGSEIPRNLSFHTKTFSNYVSKTQRGLSSCLFRTSYINFSFPQKNDECASCLWSPEKIWIWREKVQVKIYVCFILNHQFFALKMCEISVSIWSN